MFEEKTIKALRWIAGILDGKSIPYQISGGFSAKLYGSPRPLNDIDIDIPEERFKDILDDVKPYLFYGPLRHKSGKWDLYLMTLDYEGQEIDIGGAEVNISNKERTEWVHFSTDFSRARTMEVGGISVHVIPPEDLIEYKQLLDGDHQLVDIEAARKYIERQLIGTSA